MNSSATVTFGYPLTSCTLKLCRIKVNILFCEVKLLILLFFLQDSPFLSIFSAIQIARTLRHQTSRT
ncbi:MAG: hypothetical protein CXZ00_01310 [Acidobacteria bacterium]|nr:MAG: hypothetical protein CXZ00_01310 [Acidobacteriota bacterium]